MATLSEHDVVSKWTGVGRHRSPPTLEDVYSICTDILASREDEVVELNAPPDAEFDYIAIKRDEPSSQRTGVWIHSIERASQLSEEPRPDAEEEDDTITSSFLVEEILGGKIGRRRFEISAPPVPFYAPLIADTVGDECLVTLKLTRLQISRLFESIRTSLMFDFMSGQLSDMDLTLP